MNIKCWAGTQSHWVMTGKAGLRNWAFSGMFKRGIQKIPGYGLKEGVTKTVSNTALKYPSGWEWVKGLLGQRIYKP